jgi:hypothetical protein
MTTPSLPIPGWAATVMYDLGVPDVPNGKEGTMLDMGTTWAKHGSQSAKPPQDALTAAHQILQNNKSEAVTSFAKTFTDPKGPAANLADASTGAKGIGVGTMALSGIELTLKLAAIGVAGTYLASIAAAVAGAFFTGGTSLMAIAGEQAVARAGFSTAINTASNAVMGH